jgi:hypothetical protein
MLASIGIDLLVHIAAPHVEQLLQPVMSAADCFHRGENSLPADVLVLLSSRFASGLTLALSPEHLGQYLTQVLTDKAHHETAEHGYAVVKVDTTKMPMHDTVIVS